MKMFNIDLVMPSVVPFHFTLIDVLDILIVSYLLYQILTWFKGTRALQLLRGLIFIFGLYIVGELLQLTTIVWLLQKMATIIVISLIVVFQPELRRALEHLGRGKLMNRLFFPRQEEGWTIIQQIVNAIEELSRTKTGAIIAIERNTGLNEFMEAGALVDAKVHADLMISIFQKKSPLHDGAMIVQGERIAAASCFLPLSETVLPDKRLGTRHQAALGLSEMTDALIIIVSEQTGTISTAENGALNRFLTIEVLEEKLMTLYQIGVKEELTPLNRWLFPTRPEHPIKKLSRKKKH